MNANDENIVIVDDYNKIVDRPDSETAIEEIWEWYTAAVCSRVETSQHQPICTRFYNDNGVIQLLEINDEGTSG